MARVKSMMSDGFTSDVVGMLAEMNRKIDMITDRADSGRSPMATQPLNISGRSAPPAPS